MTLDFLRNIAFNGELRSFFQEDYYNFGERSTGINLRFDEQFLRKVASYYDHDESDVDNWYSRDGFRVRLANVLSQWGDRHWSDYPGGLYLGEYKDRRRIVRILIDVDTEKNSLLFEGPREYEGFPIDYRVMGPIESHFSPGSPIMVPSGGRGTLCGFLRDPSAGDIFGLTCGHVVAGQAGPISHPGGKLGPLGQVFRVDTPQGLGNCNRFAAPAANGLDVALIKVGSKVPIAPGASRVVEPIATISSGDFVEFAGQGSRQSCPAMVMGATIWKKIDLFKDGREYCCGDIFEISHRTTPYISSPLSKAGDSGAAVTRGGGSAQWLGMLIGGQRSSSFVCYSEHIMDWADALIRGISPYP